MPARTLTRWTHNQASTSHSVFEVSESVDQKKKGSERGGASGQYHTSGASLELASEGAGAAVRLRPGAGDTAAV